MMRNKVNSARRSHRSPMEPLESRTLLSAAPVGLDAEHIQWNGQDELARSGSWVVSLTGLHGKPDQQKAEADAEVKNHSDNLKVKDQLGEDGLFRIEAPREWKEGDVKAALGKMKSFRFAEPDWLL
jgi:hypothetical protein